MTDIDRQISELIHKLRAISTSDVPAATRRAIRVTADAALSRTGSAVAHKHSLPVNRLKKRLYRSRVTGTQRVVTELSGYLRPISAISLSGVRDTGRFASGSRRGKIRTKRGVRTGQGVKAGGRHWPSAWIAEGKNGKRHVFVRKGSVAYPVETISIKIKDMDAILPIALKREVASNYKRRFFTELNYRLMKHKV